MTYKQCKCVAHSPGAGESKIKARLTTFWFIDLLAVFLQSRRGRRCLWSTFFSFNYNWRLITILWWILPYLDMNQSWVYMCPPSWTLLPPPFPSQPSELSQCTSFKCPVSCIKLGLVIYFTYGNIHVSMLFSQIIPPSPSPTESKSLFCTSVSLFLFCI